jgi:hypothetical protein
MTAPLRWLKLHKALINTKNGSCALRLNFSTFFNNCNFVTSGMQGKENYSEKLFISFQLSDRARKTSI